LVQIFFLYESVRIFYANTKNYISPLGLRASKQRKHSANTNPYIAVQSSLPNITRNIITSKKDPSQPSTRQTPALNIVQIKPIAKLLQQTILAITNKTNFDTQTQQKTQYHFINFNLYDVTFHVEN
jgi:hypothetical protein